MGRTDTHASHTNTHAHPRTLAHLNTHTHTFARTDGGLEKISCMKNEVFKDWGGTLFRGKCVLHPRFSIHLCPHHTWRILVHKNFNWLQVGLPLPPSPSHNYSLSLSHSLSLLGPLSPVPLTKSEFFKLGHDLWNENCSHLIWSSLLYEN